MTVSQIAKRALLAGVVVTSIIAIVAATAGALISDLAGMLGAFVGAALGFALLGLTPLSIMWGFKLGKGDVLSPGFFSGKARRMMMKAIIPTQIHRTFVARRSTRRSLKRAPCTRRVCIPTQMV